MTTETHEHAPHTEGHTIRWWAPFYHLLSSLNGSDKIHKTTIKVAKLQPGEAVLDVGCGPGDLTLRAARKVGADGRAAGIDASPEMIAQARKAAKNKARDVDFRTAAIEDLPYGDGEFDVVLSSYMIHHLPDDLKSRGLAEAHRVLKPGGRLIVVDMGPARGIRGFFMKLIGHRIAEDYGRQLRDLITAAGFKDAELVKTKLDSSLYLLATR